jgi:hypothetical protein
MRVQSFSLAIMVVMVTGIIKPRSAAVSASPGQREKHRSAFAGPDGKNVEPGHQRSDDAGIFRLDISARFV